MERTLDQQIQDPERLTALRNTRLLDTPPEENFDQLTRMAARMLDAPVALVSLVDADRQFLKSCLWALPGQPQRSDPLSHSLCKYTLASKEPLVIRDARAHPLVKDNPAVTERGVIAYAGVPLITAEGHVLGTLCVLDAKPRDWSDLQIQKLQALATAVMSTLSERVA
jgi:GAF domain-containing protein